jgi:translocation and assembly module TamA
LVLDERLIAAESARAFADMIACVRVNRWVDACRGRSLLEFGGLALKHTRALKAAWTKAAWVKPACGGLLLCWIAAIGAVGVAGVAAAEPAADVTATDAKAADANELVSVSYDITMDGSPTDAATANLEAALAVYRYRDNGAPSIALLRRRAQDDRDIVARVLRAHGYYQATASAAVESDPPEDPQATKAKVTVTITPGRAFKLSSHAFIMTPPLPGGKAPGAAKTFYGSPVGGTAVAQKILEAEATAVNRLHELGYPYAHFGAREAIADMENAGLTITSTIETGPRLSYGVLDFKGIENIDEAYLRSYLPWQEGDRVDQRQLQAYQRDLMSTNLFAAGAVHLPETAPAPGLVPVIAAMEQRPFRSVALGARYSTDSGPGGTAEFEHRNLFGANETGTLAADLSLTEQRLEARIRKPQFWRNRQDLVGGLSLRHIESDAFDEVGATATLGLERRLSRFWNVGLGTLAEVTETVSSDSEGRSYLVGLPAFAEYDNTDNALNPSKGWRIRGAVTPFLGQYDGSLTPFLSNEVSASTYFDLTGEKRYIAAVRGRLGSILAGDIGNVPGGRRLYGGGGGSVRGYAERSIGPLDSKNEPTGGLSAMEVAAELRAQVYGDFGLAVFAAAGSVAEEVVPTFSEGVQLAAGIGLRYYSPLGPIRADIGVPLNPRSSDDSFQVYFSIGQAF